MSWFPLVLFQQQPITLHKATNVVFFCLQVCEKIPDVGRKLEYLLNTGNLVSKSGLDLSQTSGFTVVAEKLNWFRCDPMVHLTYRT